MSSDDMLGLFALPSLIGMGIRIAFRKKIPRFRSRHPILIGVLNEITLLPMLALGVALLWFLLVAKWGWQDTTILRLLLGGVFLGMAYTAWDILDLQTWVPTVASSSQDGSTGQSRRQARWSMGSIPLWGRFLILAAVVALIVALSQR
jgi:hypothetical protein